MPAKYEWLSDSPDDYYLTINFSDFCAENGDLERLQWARTKNCPWDETTAAYAAKYGHLELLRWALDNGCPWDAETRPRAGLGGHLELLKWARAKGSPWERALLFSARSLARAAKITFDRWSSAAARALRRVLYSLRARTASLCARVFQRDEHRDR
jgi:hypothetical protein